MLELKTKEHLRDWRNRATGTIALVPTMGALHEGHLALIKRAKQIADTCIVSIFVNPTQFGANEDLSKYPRTLEKDLQHCRSLEVDAVFIPCASQMYPADVLPVSVDVPHFAGILEGAHRPGHFAGVCRVCAKLFNLVNPDLACFGEKDYQQLAVLSALVADLNLDIKIEAVDTVRDCDGLALSSRNTYLGDDDRRYALGLIKALKQAKQLIQIDKETDPAAVESSMKQILTAHHLQVDYAAVRSQNSLSEIDIIEPSCRIVALVAARLKLAQGGEVRLIDNLKIDVIQKELGTKG